MATKTHAHLSLAERAEAVGNNATARFDGREIRVYAERLLKPFQDFVYQVYQRQTYGSMSRYARRHEVAFDSGALRPTEPER